jgi:predicted nuclease of predicted toxin-antitoxin system
MSSTIRNNQRGFVRNADVPFFADNGTLSGRVIEYAKEHNFTIVTFDGDFYDFSLVWGHPPKIIWIRTYIQTTKNVEEMLRKHINTLIDFQDDKELACLEIIHAS